MNPNPDGAPHYNAWWAGGTGGDATEDAGFVEFQRLVRIAVSAEVPDAHLDFAAFERGSRWASKMSVTRPGKRLDKPVVYGVVIGSFPATDTPAQLAARASASLLANYRKSRLGEGATP
jgi:hypothetical protein